MKTRNILGSLLIAVLLTACASTTPPTKTEQALYNITTNYTPKLVIVTNTVVVDVISYRTNEVGITQLVTNKVAMNRTEEKTVQVPDYVYEAKDSTKTVAQLVGTGVNAIAPGVGTIVSTAMLALLAAWGHWRGNKNKTVATTVIQELEAVREFIKTLPDGSNYDQAIVTFLKDHQVETGVATQVMGILTKNISSTEAKGAVQEINDEIVTATKT